MWKSRRDLKTSSLLIAKWTQVGKLKLVPMNLGFRYLPYGKKMVQLQRFTVSRHLN